MSFAVCARRFLIEGRKGAWCDKPVIALYDLIRHKLDRPGILNQRRLQALGSSPKALTLDAIRDIVLISVRWPL
jgi:hypothetical protein